MTEPIRWLTSTIGKRGYIADYLRAASPAGSVVIGTGNERFTPGFMSCDRSYVVPAIREDGYLNAVLGICERERITAVVTLSDLDIAVLPKLRETLVAAGIACFFPGPAIARRFLDKAETAAFLAASGFDTPRTTTDFEAAVSEIGFPMVIKPRNGSASTGFGVFHDRESAERHWHLVDLPIAQEHISGRLVNVEACSDQDGTVLGVSIWERHSSVAGETLLAETIDHPAAQRTALDLLAASPIPGPIDIDMIEAGGKLHVLEVNTRFGGGYPASHLAGADFPKALADACRGIRPARISCYRAGVTMMKQLTPVRFDQARVVLPSG